MTAAGIPMYWVYKCNSKGLEYQRAYGDWVDLFDSRRAQSWGTTKNLPELEKAQVGDTVLAYQTDRNELVGVARVVGWRTKGKSKSLILKPVRVIGARVRPLKEANAKVARIPALQPGPIKTLYRISRADAARLLKAAGTHFSLGPENGKRRATTAVKGAAFGTPEQNRLVEQAAARHIVRHYQSRRWLVSDVSSENRGYDLLCRRRGEERHVEVKGARAGGQQFIITAKELHTWKNDRYFVLAWVGNACSANPSISFFPGAKSQSEFSLSPLSFIAKRRPA